MASDGSRDSRVPLVGRDIELAAVLDALEEPAAERRGIILLSGEPGVGKSRLIAEVSARAEARGWLRLLGHAYDSEGMPPYLPFVEALGDYIRRVPDADVPELLGESARQLSLLLPEIHHRLPDQPASSALDPESERYRLFESIAEVLVHIAGEAERGLLLCLDDLHWADNSTLLLLEHLLRRITGERVVILTAYRETDLEVSRPTRPHAGADRAAPHRAAHRSPPAHERRRASAAGGAGRVRTTGRRRRRDLSRDGGEPVLRP